MPNANSQSTALRSSVGKGGVNQRQDVKNVQSLLNQHIGRMTPLRPLVVDGITGRNTALVIEEFQRRIVGVARPDGRVDPGGRTLRALAKSTGTASPATDRSGQTNIRSGFDKLRDVKPELREKVIAFAAVFGPIKISSGLRTVRKQAELMAVMTDRDLNMYGSNTSYVRKIKALSAAERTVDAVEVILARARAQGSRISYHLAARAVDISGRAPFDWDRAKQLAEGVGLTVKLERWRNCFHVQI